MPKGTLQIAYENLSLDNLELKDRIKGLEAKNRNLRMDVKLWKNRTTEAAKAVEDFEELEAENKQLRSIKCPPISEGDSCICPIEELESENKKLREILAREVNDGRAEVDDIGIEKWIEQALNS